MPVETAGGQSPLVVGFAGEGFQLALPPVPNEVPHLSPSVEHLGDRGLLWARPLNQQSCECEGVLYTVGP